MGKQIGIDLGTTNSVACFYDGRETRILLNTFQEELTPSVVALHRLDESDPGQTVVGRSAVSQAKLYPRDTIYSIKRLMGRTFKKREVQDWRARVNYEIVEDERGRAAVMLGGQRKTPEEISAEILKNIKSYAERVLGEPVTHAVITVPAYFGEPERAATRDAGRAAGQAALARADRRSHRLWHRSQAGSAPGAGLRPGWRHVRHQHPIGGPG